MSLVELPPDVKRIIANLSNLTISDIRNLCRTYRGFNESVCKQNQHLKDVLRQVRAELTDNYAVIKGKTLTELEQDLQMLQSIANIDLLRNTGYEKANYNRFTRVQMILELGGRRYRGIGHLPRSALITILEGGVPEGFRLITRRPRVEDEAISYDVMQVPEEDPVIEAAHI